MIVGQSIQGPIGRSRNSLRNSRELLKFDVGASFLVKMQQNEDRKQQEEMRQKRLEKLAQQQQQAKEQALPAKQPNLTPKPMLEPPQVQPKVAAKTTPLPTVASPKMPKRDSLTAEQAFLRMTDAQWESQVSQSIFGLTISSLPELEQEFLQEGLPLELNSQVWERVLFAKFQGEGDFEYLVNCWKRAQTKLGNLSKIKQEQDVVKRRSQKLLELQDLLLNYCGLFLNPETCEMFPLNHTDGAGVFGAKLCRIENIETEYPRSFIDSIIQKFKDSGLDIIVSCTILALMKEMNSKKLYNPDYRLPVRALFYLISFKDIANLIVQMPEWCNGQLDARRAETDSVLGPFFSRPSTFPDSDSMFVTSYFGTGNEIVEDLVSENAVGGRNYGNIKSAQDALHLIAAETASSLKDICMSFIKASPEGKEAILYYFYKMLQLNMKRSHLQVDRAVVCSEGFIYNITNVCKLLVDPILDANFSKLGLIDPFYFMYQKRLDISEETRINVDLESAVYISKSFMANNPNHPTPNFVTEIFYLTIAAHHYGPLSAIRLYKNFTKELEGMQAQLSRVHNVYESGAWNSIDAFTRNSNEQGYRRLKKHVDQLLGVKIAFEGAIMSVHEIEDTLRFYDLVMLWLVKMAVGPEKNVSWSALATGDSCGY